MAALPDIGARLAKVSQLQRFLDPWGAPDIAWLHSHCVVRGLKVIVNVYDIGMQKCNSCLISCYCGGAHHTGMEINGVEYCFGGSSNDALGIMSIKPLHVLRKEAVSRAASAHDAGDAIGLDAAQQQLDGLPPLRTRRVVGWWMGSTADFEQVLTVLHFEHEWRGPTYRLLSRNCNHFMHALCAALLECPQFKPAPGCTAPSAMLPLNITRLTSCLLCCCSVAPRFKQRLNMPMVLAPYVLNVFQGSPETIRRAVVRDVLRHNAQRCKGAAGAGSVQMTPMTCGPEAQAMTRSQHDSQCNGPSEACDARDATAQRQKAGTPCSDAGRHGYSNGNGTGVMSAAAAAAAAVAWAEIERSECADNDDAKSTSVRAMSPLLGEDSALDGVPLSFRGPAANHDVVGIEGGGAPRAVPDPLAPPPHQLPLLQLKPSRGSAVPPLADGADDSGSKTPTPRLTARLLQQHDTAPATAGADAGTVAGSASRAGSGRQQHVSPENRPVSVLSGGAIEVLIGRNTPTPEPGGAAGGGDGSPCGNDAHAHHAVAAGTAGLGLHRPARPGAPLPPAARRHPADGAAPVSEHAMTSIARGRQLASPPNALHAPTGSASASDLRASAGLPPPHPHPLPRPLPSHGRPLSAKSSSAGPTPNGSRRDLHTPEERPEQSQQECSLRGSSSGGNGSSRYHAQPEHWPPQPRTPLEPIRSSSRGHSQHRAPAATPGALPAMPSPDTPPAAGAQGSNAAASPEGRYDIMQAVEACASRRRASTDQGTLDHDPAAVEAELPGLGS